ncbi:MAG: Nitrilotriacetate monooxygenase component B [uncultured Cytophagales bacterium]|uniref:Nitrilotriacetate monooxygenase component B n=1 Tax=uncultured Cytophagales bacterium TaxID=158755 RepID=A0A6J4HNT8_9SPHI|nr:MAG: Nitrilotriacetate monooxygenase component B [uncultured Cytophagales bacterium]
MKTIDPKEVSVAEFHGYLLGTVAPRPIAFASTIDAEGRVNLSPYSFFNAFGSNPPTLIFSPNRRVRDNTPKHTYENVKEVAEVVINVVDYKMVEQMSLASCEYERGVDEFTKAGFTPVPSTLVRPPRVAESPAAFECKVLQVIEMGDQGGAPNLVICQVLLAHFHDGILNAQGRVDTTKVDLVARMGGDWYCRAHGPALFEVPKPNQHRGIGIDQLPAPVRNSRILTGNNLGRLANVEKLPDPAAVRDFRQASAIREAFAQSGNRPEALESHLHALAKQFLEANQVEQAWLTLLQGPV